MKFLVVLAILFLLQAIAAQQIKDDHKPDHIIQGHEGTQVNKQGVHTQINVSGHKAQVKTSTSQVHKEQHQQQINVDHNSQVSQHVAQPVAQNVVQHDSIENHKPTSASTKKSVQIPPKVQQIVTHVSQHIPNVVSQHVANQQHNKQRMVRSLMNKLTWKHPVNGGAKPRKCAYDCSPTDLPVCAYNGRCYREFESQCEMSAYNCLNIQKRFQLAHDAECQDLSAVKCYPGDM